MEIIKVENLKFYYEKQIVLNDINFTVNNGDFVSILGSNGSGKSTLIKLLLRELTPDSGNINWFENDIKINKSWNKIGYVPQHNILNENRFPATVLEVVKANLFSDIGFMKFPNKSHIKKAISALKMVGMESFSKKLIGNLSGGQQQKIMLARALVNDPQILILDEPTTGIDQNSCNSLYELLERFNKEKKLTVIMVTHDIGSVYKYLNKAFYLEKNSLLELSLEQIANFESEIILCNHIPHIKLKDILQ